MSSLIVLLPSISTFDARRWAVVAMPYALFDWRGQLLRAGHANRDAWPKAAAIVLVIAARDTLLVDVSLPPVTGAKLRRVLPHAVEEYLIGDAQQSHVAVGPATSGNTVRPLAVVERARFGDVIDWLGAAGHRRVRAVPLIHCMPVRDDEPADAHKHGAAPEANGAQAVRATPDSDEGNDATAVMNGEADVLIVCPPASCDAGDAVDVECEAGNDPQRLELAVKRGASGFGFETHAAGLDVAIAELSKRDAVRVHALVVSAHDATESAVVEQGVESGRRGNGDSGAITASVLREGRYRHSAFPLAALTLPWEALARGALACPFDLCQFEFARNTRTGGGGWRRWRVPVGLAIASAVVAIATINVQWFQLRHRQDALNAQLTDRVKAAFPGTTVMLDPPMQMRTGLERLRTAAGELRPDDYLVLAAALSRALGPIPSDAIATLDYRDGTLAVAFRPGTAIDGEGFRGRLQAQGATVNQEDAKWMLGSKRPAPR
ncbi:type II secretion system protein GspL [Burkholderia catarinensis]|uniref:type II secretion system protein GspL n=1 Tax=Burkholderia catarinensis TaxID=1108140 RepID=UPI001C5922CD|nr:type II secretion system protein GspL [Burkholderia catarinensis]KAG8148907.1 hypothetical protein BFF94_035445 [Burkholderia catarinensis]